MSASHVLICRNSIPASIVAVLSTADENKALCRLNLVEKVWMRRSSPRAFLIRNSTFTQWLLF